MSIARALTKRYKESNTLVPGRAMSKRYGLPGIDRAQISLPTELISTTNQMAYDAPNLHDFASSSSASSTKSYEDSDASPTFSSTPETSRETSPTTVMPNHLSGYFQSRSSIDSRQSSTSSNSDAPAVPSRAPSHTKKSHQVLARKRSQGRVHGPAQDIAQSVPTVRSSVDMFSNKPESNHPFGAELAQVNELAEEFGAQDVRIWDEEEQFLMDHGLQKFRAEDYINDIQGLFGGVFDDKQFPMRAGWI